MGPFAKDRGRADSVIPRRKTIGFGFHDLENNLHHVSRCEGNHWKVIYAARVEEPPI
jgi:hypothetical protein